MLDLPWRRPRKEDISFTKFTKDIPLKLWPPELSAEQVTPTWSWASVPGPVEFDALEILNAQFAELTEIGRLQTPQNRKVKYLHCI